MSEWARPGELEVFATGTTTLSERDHDPDHHDDRHRGASELLHRAGAAVLDLQARPGHRPGQRIPPTSARRGGDTDIVRPLLVRPWAASKAATSGRWFDEPIDGFDLEYDRDHTDDDRYLVWHGALSGSHVTRVPVSVHLLAAPSMVVTVLELVPQRRLRWHRNGFVADGIAVIDRLADRLLSICAADRAIGATAVARIA
jgi:hypothetical protein